MKTNLYLPAFLLLAACSSVHEKEPPSMVQALNHEQTTDLKHVNAPKAVVEKVNTIDKTVPYPRTTTQPSAAQWRKFKKHKSDWALSITSKHPLYSFYVDSLVNVRYRYVENTGEYEDYALVDVLSRKYIKQLTTKELLYYCLAYPGLYSQNCNAVFWPRTKGKYFYAQLPNDGDSRVISDLQKASLKARRPELVSVITECIKNSDTADMGVLLMAKEFRVTETIPFLCDKADFNENAHCYTVLIALMNKSNYKPYYNSALYLKVKEYFEFTGATDEEAEGLKKVALEYYRQAQQV